MNDMKYMKLIDRYILTPGGELVAFKCKQSTDEDEEPDRGHRDSTTSKDRVTFRECVTSRDNDRLSGAPSHRPSGGGNLANKSHGVPEHITNYTDLLATNRRKRKLVHTYMLTYTHTYIYIHTYILPANSNSLIIAV